MKPTFLNQNRPLVTGMLLKDNPDSIIYGIKNSIYDGADCLGIQLEYLKKEYKNLPAFLPTDKKILSYVMRLLPHWSSGSQNPACKAPPQ